MTFCDLSLTLTCAYYKHEIFTGSSLLIWEHLWNFVFAAIDSLESVADNLKTMSLTFYLTLHMTF